MNSKYEDLNYLYKQLIEGNELIPNVIGAEASAGKTTSACEGMIEAYNKNGRRSHLITKESKECIDIVKKCNEIAGYNIAGAFISKDDELEEEYIIGIDDLHKYPIIISTHRRYMMALEYLIDDRPFKDKLRENEKTLMYISMFKYFHNFIIDEQIDLVKNTYAYITLSDLNNLINSAKEYDSKTCLYKVSKFVMPLINYIKGYDIKEDKLVRCDLVMKLEDEIWYMEKQMNQMILALKAQNETLKGFTIEGLEKMVRDISLIYKNIKEIMGISLATAIIYKSNDDIAIATYNYRFNFNLLLSKNNYILDASSPFMSIYDSSMFKKIKTERLISHKDCRFIVNRFNTSSSALRADIACTKINFIKSDINRYEGEKLVVAKDKDENTYKTETIAFENFETAKAKNKYKDFKNVFIAQTPRIYLPYYVFCSDFYNNEITENIKYEKNNIRGIRFVNEKIRNIYVEYTADLIYQAIKRVERNTEPKANYVLYSSFTEAILIIYKQLFDIPMPEVSFMDDKFTVFYRMGKFFKDIWDGNRLYLNDLEIMFACSRKAIINALDKMDKLGVISILGIVKGKYNRSSFIQSEKLIEERAKFSDLELLMKDIQTVEKDTSKRKVKKMSKINEFLQQFEGGFMFEADIKKFQKLIGEEKPKKVNEKLKELSIEYTILNQPSHGKKRWKVERDIQE